MKSLRKAVVVTLVGLSTLLVTAVLLTAVFAPSLLRLVAQGETRELRDADPDEPSAEAAGPTLLIIGIDGVERGLLYPLLREGKLPGLAKLLGGEGHEGAARFPHAHFDEHILSTLPSSTLTAWASIFTGVVPSEHGVAGNEFFIRESRRLAAPIPVSIGDPEPVLQTYTDGYANELLTVPTIYEQWREVDPSISIWVSMSQFHRGADKLLLAGRTVLSRAVEQYLAAAVKDDVKRGVYAQLDEEVLETLCDALDDEAAPRVLTLYLSGTDLYAHVAPEGPDVARAAYLVEVLDPMFEKLAARLDEARAREDRYVVLVSDHGHTEVLHDERHAMSTKDTGDPPAVLRGAGFRLRPFKLDVTEDENDYQAVLTYGGALAYVYLADRSTCPDPKTVCDFARPPRFREDVLPVAEAFFQANRSGAYAPELRGTMDMILTRHPKPYAETDEPFSVYGGGGKLVPLRDWVAANRRDAYVALEERMRELAVGRYGERAGDVLLVAHSGNRERVEERFYFADEYRSWHGSPSRKDSEIAFIVAHPRRSSEQLARVVSDALGNEPRQHRVARVLSRLLGHGNAQAGL
jgi:hypothetical protein